MIYKTKLWDRIWFWDRIWMWKEKMKELKMEVVQVPLLAGQHILAINHMNASIYH